MRTIGKTLLFFSAITIVSSFLSASYASDVLEEESEKQRLVINIHSQANTSYESLGLNVSDTEEEDLEKQTLDQTLLENDGKCYGCCLGCYRAIPWWTETTATLALVASSIIFPTITYFPFEDSTRRIIGTVGTFVAFSGVMAKAYQWCVDAEQ